MILFFSNSYKMLLSFWSDIDFFCFILFPQLKTIMKNGLIWISNCALSRKWKSYRRTENVKWDDEFLPEFHLSHPIASTRIEKPKKSPSVLFHKKKKRSIRPRVRRESIKKRRWVYFTFHCIKPPIHESLVANVRTKWL